MKKHDRMIRLIGVIGILCCMIASFGCRGWRSEKPPVHPNPNLDFQAKYKAQKLPLDIPEGTIPFGKKSLLTEDRAAYIDNSSVTATGKTKRGSWIKKAPVTVTREVVLRGKERYEIYCSPCHARTGSGNGMVVQRGFLQPPHLEEPHVIAHKDGKLFDIISNGVRNMPRYNHLISVEDRWAIVLYVRAIQTMHTGTIRDVPKSKRSQL